METFFILEMMPQHHITTIKVRRAGLPQYNVYGIH